MLTPFLDMVLRFFPMAESAKGSSDKSMYRQSAEQKWNTNINTNTQTDTSTDKNTNANTNTNTNENTNIITKMNTNTNTNRCVSVRKWPGHCG